jgi:hypothetical protein
MTRDAEAITDAVHIGRRGSVWVWVALVAGVVGLGVSFVLGRASEEATQQLLRSYLVAYMYFLGLGMGGLFFVMVTHLTRAGWSVALRRLAEAVSFAIVPMAVLLVPILLGIHDLYEWSHESEVAGDALLEHKAPYLNTTFFVWRLIGYFAVWVVLTVYFVRRSLQQDRTGDARLTLEMEKVSAPGMILYALTLTFAVFDLLMSLYPHWYSTIFGLYYWSGAVVGFFALLAMLLFALQRVGLLRGVVSGEHYHDVGKLIFAFVVFWAYMAVSQYLLIWYGNIPEETVWYLRRQTGQWTWVSVLLIVGHFFVPFLALMSRHPKRRPVTLVIAAAWVLIVHWWDVYWLVMPEWSPETLPLGLYDVTCFVGVGGVFLAAVLFRLTRSPLIPVKDPRLHESLQWEQA